MNNQIYPCLWFDGNAQEAAEFYCNVFKNSKITSQNPMVTAFELNGKKMVSLNGGPMFKFTPSISFSVNCTSVDEVNEIWNQLIDGGSTMMPLDKYPWSERYGWLKDKYNLTWQVSLPNVATVQQEIIPSFLFTDSNFGKAEEAINFYTSIFDNASCERLIHYDAADVNAGKVLYAEFRLKNQKFIAMDGPGAHNFAFNEALSFVVDCETQEQIDYYWQKLTEDGGTESQCGWLKDKFGVSWQIVPTILASLMNDPQTAERVMPVFLKMKKFEIAKLLEA
jgi:predicted 3-demethylubiquinone-9 3-methyltransferase (glyoxalase superfamily)